MAFTIGDLTGVNQLRYMLGGEGDFLSRVGEGVFTEEQQRLMAMRDLDLSEQEINTMLAEGSEKKLTEETISIRAANGLKP